MKPRLRPTTNRYEVFLVRRLHTNLNSGQRFRHLDEVAGQLCFDVRGKGMRSRLDIASAAIETEKVLAQVDDLDVHNATSQAATVFFGGVHQQRAKAAVLARGIDCQ